LYISAHTTIDYSIALAHRDTLRPMFPNLCNLHFGGDAVSRLF